jgi:membrane protein implicated in regulation of membrane protease activity
MQPLPGNPTALRNKASHYSTVAEAILSTARRLDSLATDGTMVGDSIDALKVRADAAAGTIRTVHPRYSETAEALKEYSVHLRDAQDAANAAIAKRNTVDDGHLGYLRFRKHELQAEKIAAALHLLPEEERDRIDHDLRLITNKIHNLEATISAANTAYEQALHDRDQAATHAVDRIRPVLATLNDSMLDKIGAALGSLAGFLTQISEWVKGVLVRAVEALLTFAAALIALAAIVLIVIIIYSLLAALSPLLGILFLAALAVAIVAIAALIVRSVVREMTTPTPEMTEKDVTGGMYGKRVITADDDSLGEHFQGNYERIFADNQLIDDRGQADSTAVEVVTVKDENGNIVGYRVVLPSTQDWEELNGVFHPDEGPTGDKGAVNDLGSNIALLMMPESARGPYERAVIEAIEQRMKADGTYDKQIPVMLSGFSQGGILAGRLASNPPSWMNVTAVVTAGSCIDSFDIPSNVSVLALQHPDDPVPMLDGNIVGKNRIGLDAGANSNQYTIAADKYPGTDAHGAKSYATTAYQVIDQSTDPGVMRVVQDQSMFFSSNESVYIYQGHE